MSVSADGKSSLSVSASGEKSVRDKNGLIVRMRLTKQDKLKQESMLAFNSEKILKTSMKRKQLCKPNMSSMEKKERSMKSTSTAKD